MDDAGSIGGDVVDGSVVVCFAESNNRLAQVSNEVCCVGCGMVDTMEWLTATRMAPMRSFMCTDYARDGYVYAGSLRCVYETKLRSSFEEGV